MGVDALFALLVVIATWQTLAAPTPERIIGLACGVALVGAYAWGRSAGLAEPAAAGSTRMAIAWLAGLGVLWIGLLLASPAALWLAFPLMIVQVHVLGAHRGGLAVAATVVVAAFVGLVVHPGDAFGSVLGPVVGGAVALFAVSGFHVLQREVEIRQQTVDELASVREHLAQAERDKVVVAERERLAREIHDTLAQSLSGIGLLLDVAQGRIGVDDVRATDLVRQAREATTGCLADARRVVYELTPAELEDSTLVAAIRRVAAQAERSAGDRGIDLEVRVDVAQGVPSLPVAVETGLLRVVQSCLANVVQHARATRVDVSLAVTDGQAVVDVVDDGVGFDPERMGVPQRDRGFGLPAMKSRVAQMGGVLAVEASPGGGTAVTVSVPVSLPADEPVDDRVGRGVEAER